MAIGPNGPLPGMGGVPGPPAAAVPMGPPVGNLQPGGDEMAAKQRLMEIVAEAEAILSQFPNLAGELVGENQPVPTPVGVPGGMPPMPVGGNTGALGGGGLIA